MAHAVKLAGVAWRFFQVKLLMVNYQKYAVTFVTYLAIALTNFAWVFPAGALTQNLRIKSNTGYRVETVFSYDENRKTNILDSLQVDFYDPDGKIIASYDNIVDGIVQGKYFEFHYNQETQQLSGKLDLGGESAGDIYLKGNVEQELSLIMIEGTGEEKTIDNGQWTVATD